MKNNPGNFSIEALKNIFEEIKKSGIHEYEAARFNMVEAKVESMGHRDCPKCTKKNSLADAGIILCESYMEKNDAALRAKLKTAVEALKWYANSENYDDQGSPCCLVNLGGEDIFEPELGEIACQALKEIGE